MVKYILTNHLRERYLERFNKKFRHLQQCSLARCNLSCSLCVSLLFELRREVTEIQRRRVLDSVIFNRLTKAHEECSHLNNTEFMSRLYDRYGFGRFHFLCDEDVLFIVVNENGKKIVPTCIPARGSVVGGIACRPKYRKKVPGLLPN